MNYILLGFILTVVLKLMTNFINDEILPLLEGENLDVPEALVFVMCWAVFSIPFVGIVAFACFMIIVYLSYDRKFLQYLEDAINKRNR